jgi:hypothetical protein
MTEPASYVDPLEEALARGMQHIAELTSLVAAAAEVAMRRAAARQPQSTTTTSQAGDQENARLQASLHWAPAHDRRWLANADLLQTARTWSAAAAYADIDPVAAAAMTKCETRLRALHPFAMARYDRLRSESVAPLAAMSESAPLFRLAPSARPGHPAPDRPALEAESSSATDASDDPVGMPVADPPAKAEALAEQRGHQIAQRLAAAHRAVGRGEIELENLELLLEARTTLPADVIERIVQTAAAASGSPVGEAARTAAHLAAESFPHPVSAVVSVRTNSQIRPRRDGAPHRGDPNPDRASRRSSTRC